MNLIIISGLLGVLLMFTGVFVKNKRTISYVAIAAVLFALIANTAELQGHDWFNINAAAQMLQPNTLGLLMNEIMLLSCLIYFILSGRAIEQVGEFVADYYALIFFILAGVGIVTSFTNLLMLFLGIEIISIPLYILTGSDKRNLKSNEASLKYFLMGAFSTGLMLMGIALIYGGTGSFELSRIQTAQVSYNLVGGLLLLFCSMLFKVSGAPFHFWTPDVYDGAPTVFTSFMATIVKVAAFVAFIHMFDATHGFIGRKYQLMVSIIIALTLLFGNITAVFQQSVKRMLAYSSIAQAGFMLFALFAFTPIAREAIVLYGAAYCFATIGIFAVLVKMEDYTYDGFNGLAKSEPLLALLVTVFLFSLAGIPLTLGFFSKYYMIASALSTGGQYLWLVILAMLCAAVSVYYYFRVIQAMYFKPGVGQTIEHTVPFKVALVALAAMVLIFGIMPQALLQFLYF